MLISGLLSKTVAADQLPEGERINIGTPNEKQCYDLDEYKQILRIAVNHNNCLEANKLKDEKITSLNLQIGLLEDIVETQEDSINVIQADRDRMFLKWKEENKLRHEAENRPQWGSWVAWSVAAVATVAGVTAITISVTR